MAENYMRQYSIDHFGYPPQVFWFMSKEMRSAIINGTQKIGDAFIIMEEHKPDPNADWPEMKANFDSAIKDLLSEILAIGESDLWRGDDLFINAIVTRIDAYLKADGMGHKERKEIIDYYLKFLTAYLSH